MRTQTCYRLALVTVLLLALSLSAGCAGLQQQVATPTLAAAPVASATGTPPPSTTTPLPEPSATATLVEPTSTPAPSATPQAPAGESKAAASIDLAARSAAIDRALAWLLALQEEDGGFPSDFGRVGVTAEAVLAGVAAGEDVAQWRANAESRANGDHPSVLDYLATQIAEYAEGTNAGQAGKLLAAVAAAGSDPRAFGGANLVALVIDYDDGSGSMDAVALNQSWAVLGLTAAGERPPKGALETLLAMQNEDGGWDGGYGTDPQTTALAIQALIAAGLPVQDEAITDGLAYLADRQSETGGFFYDAQWGTQADADTTGRVLLALGAAQANALAGEWLAEWRSATEDLLGLQADDGGFPYQAGGEPNALSTAKAVLGLVGRSLPLPNPQLAVREALDYMRSVQQANGSYEDKIGASSQALLALAAAGENARQWKGADGQSLPDYVASATDQIADAGSAGRLVMALAQAGENPYLVGCTNVVSLIVEFYDETSGAYDENGSIWNQSLAMMGLLAVGEPVPEGAVAWLMAQQNADGGWGWGAGVTSDSNSTALAAQALIAAGIDRADPAMQQVAAYLHQQQTAQGGFAWDTSDPVSQDADANSTAIVIQGLLALGQDPSSGWDWARPLTATAATGGVIAKPLDQLLAFQLPEGALEWQPGMGANFLATAQAIPALLGQAFPWESPRLTAARAAVSWIKTQQQADGSFPSPFDPTGVTLDALLAGVAAGEDVATWSTEPDSPTALDYLADQVESYAVDAGAAGKLLAVAVAAGQDPTTFGKSDLLATLQSFGTEGAYADGAIAQAWAMLGLAAAGQPLTEPMVQHLLGLQNEDGGWGWGEGASGTDTTATALLALSVAGKGQDDEAVARAVDYLRGNQASSGGFFGSAAFGTEANTNSTAMAVLALLALDQDPGDQAWRAEGQNTPLDDLLGLQLENGAFEWQPGMGADVMATSQAVPALLCEPLPLCALPVAE